jgi:deferrochelatase/peroxidase EfeB
MVASPDLADVQGNILRGYRKPLVRHLVLGVADRSASGNWLLDATGRDPVTTHQVTSAEPWDYKPPTCLNVSVTPAGLGALGVPERSVKTFPTEFVAGMASRAVKIGDVGASAPSTWRPEWRDADRLHLVVTVHADSAEDRDVMTRRVLGAGSGRAFHELARLDGEAFPGGLVHFGYRDSIAQPRFEGIRDAADRPDRQPLVEVGAVLLGYPTPLENVIFELPQPTVLGQNGAFNAFRVLEQRVVAFETFLTTSAETILASPLADVVLPVGIEREWDPPMSRLDALRELVAAKVLGRWRNGVPLALSPHSPTPTPPIGEHQLNDFGYQRDPDGERCPLGSHIRRCNPRDARIVQRSANHTRRIVRRGIPYGPPLDPGRPDHVERGLLGSFICASLIVQFESIQYDWMNLGLLDPRITGTNDVVVGNNDPQFSSFQLAVGETAIELRGFPRFVETRGGAYLFLPGITALRHLGTTAA